ncbi:hypothetical protein FKW77_000546 [Venturia effusa]|uniref:Altered inheritance of mitochondria protein 9, mitochondrial n=1 Tax=Venturia effusa TaxID=50376 RepID=A0A517LQN5_9PEZI|nr:hypothetical protein FKW77_000546 [Venturia effusa]
MMDAGGAPSANDDPLSSPQSSVLSDLSPPRSDLANHQLTRDSLNFGVAAPPPAKNNPLVPPPATSTTSSLSGTDQKQKKSRAPVVLPDGTVRERKKPGPKPKPKDPNAPEKPRKKRQKLSDVQAPTSAPVQTKLFNNVGSMEGVEMYRQDQARLAQPSPAPQQRAMSEMHLGSTLPSNSLVAPLGTPNTPRPASSGRIFDPIRGDTVQAGQQSSRMSNPSASPTQIHKSTNSVSSNLVTSAPVSPLPPTTTATKPQHSNPFSAPPNSALAPHLSTTNLSRMQSTTAMEIDAEVKPAKQSSSAGPASNAPTPPAAPKRAKEQPPPLPSGSGLLSATPLGSIGSAPTNGNAGTNIFLTFSLVGQNNVTINFAREVERKYGFAALHPRLAARNERKRALAAASNALEKEAGVGSVDDMSLDLSEPDSNNETGGNEEDSANAPTDGRKRRKKKAEEYDRGDDFIDDTEMAWEESALMAKDGFFVYSGPLVTEPEKVTIERADGTVKRGRGRGRGGTARGDATGRGRGGGGGRGSRGGATVRKPRVTKADRAMMEQEKLEREKMAANLAAKQSGVPQYEIGTSEDLVNYTRGRFVCNERYELSQRCVRFNVAELTRRAVEAVRARTCVSISKYPDGMYNKAMLLTMDNGSRVVAKVPNPNAGLPHFTTASKVATMHFARNVLRTPVPKVLAWCSHAHESPVGAEYIIMEQVPGIELEHVWPQLNIKDRFAVVKAIAGFQKSWTEVSFAKYGSLYFSKDLDDTPVDQPLYVDAKGNRIINTCYAIGLSTGREYFDSGRATVNFDRGPWSSLEAYHVAIGHREIACVNQLPELPKSPITLCGPGTYQPTRAKKLKALGHYLDIIRALLPKDEEISSAHLWHDDLHLVNRAMSAIFPCRQPHIIDYIGSPINGLARPQPRKDLDKLEPSARQQAESLYLHQSLCSLYNTLTHHQNLRLYAALQFQQTQKYLLLLLARNILIDGEVSYLSRLAELESTWTDFSADTCSTCPFTFSNEDRKDLEADMQGVTRGMEAMRSIRDSLGELFPEQGIVRPDQYDEALDALAQMRE